MKRSSCSGLLSALLVGFSVTTASVAFAAPPSGTVQVAQAKPGEKPGTKTVQPTDPPPAEGGGATPAPPPPAEPAPADPAPTTATPAPENTNPSPAISIGTSGTPTTDSPSGGAEAAKKPKPRAWAGSQVTSYTSMNTNTIFRGQTQDVNPTVDSSIWLLPRYTINESFQLRGRLIFNYEWTNSDTTVTKNEPRFSDTTIQLFYRKIPEIPGVGIKPAVALNAGFPTSPESRARTMIFTPGATLQLSKTVEHVLGGELAFIASTAYSHPLYRSTTPEIRGNAPYAFQCAGGNGCQDQLSGVFNPSDSLLYSAVIAGEWGKWAPGLLYLGSSQWAYTGREVANPVDGTPVQSAQSRPTSVRQSSYFAAWIDYNFNAWFTTELGYSLSRSALNEDATRGNPFYDRYQDMRLYVGFNFNIDNLMKQLEGGPADAGIVRAQNTKRPLWVF